jgi:two-component system, LytTR family, sensor kinase
MQSSSGHVRSRVIFGVATALGFFSGFQAYYYVSTFTEWPASLPFLIALNLGFWYSWACLTPAILWLSRKAPFLERESWKRAAAVHLPAVVVMTLLHVSLTVASQTLIVWLVGQEQRPWLPEAQRMFFNNFDWEMMTYWAIVGLSHALRYHSEAQDRALRASQLETRLVEAQLQALQRQLHPHFLFNTLNAIAALVRDDPSRAEQMVEQLSTVLRGSLNTAVTVPIDREMKLVDDYLHIQQARLGARLRFALSWDRDGLVAATIPPFAVQTLVENAIKHVGSVRPEGVALDVRAARRGNFAVIEVHDDGGGFDSSAPEPGHGLGNVQARLHAIYGGRAGLEFDRSPDGMTVRVRVPLPSEP